MASINKFWIQISAFVAFILFVIAACFPFINRVEIRILPTNASPAGSFRSPKQNVWADLSREEAEDVIKYLFTKSDLNLTEASKATAFVSIVP